MATFICQQCGGTGDAAPGVIRRGRRYCSSKCKAAAATTRPERGKVELTCLRCGGQFLCPKAWARDGRRKFCSRECKDRLQETITGEANPKFGIPRPAETRERISRTRMERGSSLRGEKHPHWKGGRLNHQGYVSVLIETLPPDQRAMARQMRPVQGYINEHRLVVAMIVGRPLDSKEVVHHKNGIRSDNRPENLVLMDWGPHSRKHRHIERELAAAMAEVETLKAENARLKSLLKTCRPDGSATLNPPERI